jgi:hypothetical protein
MIKCLFATASALILYSTVGAFAQGLPFMLQSTTDQPSSVNQLPSRAQSADQADPGDLQRGRSAELRDSAPVNRRPRQDLQEAKPGGQEAEQGDQEAKRDDP